MCDRSHTYTVEVIGATPRYSGTSEDEAVSALLTIDPDYDEEGYVVAEHRNPDDIGYGPSTTYCPAESNRIENEAITAAAVSEAKRAQAVEAFHGDGPYALTPPF